MTTFWGVCFVVLAVTACGSDTKKKTGKYSNNNTVNNTNNTNNTNNNTTGTNNIIDPARCGDGTLDPGELCDPLIESGAGACPDACDDAAACFTSVLTGNADECTARCEAVPVACSQVEDGCCSLGCDASNDADCTNQCGNGTVEDGEVCDGNCPTSCDDSNACTADSFTGSAETCSFQCVNTPRTACTNNDGCCPAGCTTANDSDCSSTCGNGQIDANETCDGDCPTNCNDNNSCTQDRLTGSAASCSAQCSNSPLTTCQSGDGCCPTGCTTAVDNDCACVPTTSCAAQGLNCGTIFNGCQNVNCGSCGNGESCNNNVCTVTLTVGTACTSDANCVGSQCLTAADVGWAGGYCTLACTSNAQCGTGNRCGYKNPDNGNQGFCVKGCSTNADCGRAGYACFDADQDGVNECSPTGSGSAAVGAPCTTIQQCSGGNDGFCIRQTNSWYQGYCSRSCNSNADCGSGAHCATNGFCFANTCNRTGYSVFDADEDGINECYTSATGNGAVGQACEGNWQCAGLQWGACASEEVSGLPGGYCTLFCGFDQGSCTGDSACYNTGNAEICLDGCSTSTNCRAGYTCADFIGLGTNSCWL